MKRYAFFATAFWVASFVALPASSIRADAVLQEESRERFGEKDFAYFFIEAEDFHDSDPRFLGETWLVSSDPLALFTTVNDVLTDPLTGDLLEDDPGAFASGDESITNAIFTSTVTNESGGGHDVQYIVVFDTPGIYYLYIRQHSPLGPEGDRNKNDSFYYPVEFGEDPRQLKANGDDYGILESAAFEGDTFTRGPWLWFAARQFVENSEQNPLSEQNEFTFQEFEITDDMVGEELIFEFDHREDGVMIDAFLFIETTSGLPPTDGRGPDGLGFFGIGDAVDEEFGLENFSPPSDEPCAVPDIDAVTPAEGRAGDSIAITGTNLACDAGVTVTICGIEVEVSEITDESITAIVPECASAGAVDVTVTHTGAESDTLRGGFVYVAEATFKRGDCDGNGRIQATTDAIALLGYNFLEGAATPPCLSACDVNFDERLAGVTDAVYLLSFSFLGGPAPAAPHPDCGPASAGDATIGCETSLSAELCAQ